MEGPTNGESKPKTGSMYVLENDLPLITVDSEQIKQVVLNLAINALQVMPEGGTLQFHTIRMADGVVIEVEDEGGGVDPVIASRIFDPFFTTKKKGVGLGLSVGYKIAQQHGGALTVSNATKGAIFRLTLVHTRLEGR